MNYFLYQLQFNTAVHFGASDSALSLHHSQMHFRADTLFSALCHTVLQLDGEAGLNRLVQLASGGALLLSDSMPWEEDRFYLPKPIYAPQAVAEIPGEKRKALKKLVWIPVEAFPDFCAALRTGAFVDIPATAFGTEVDAVKAAAPETEDTLPYPVGLYRFFDGRGLYFLLGCEDQADGEWLASRIRALGLGGIGGKTSAGFGKFEVKKAAFLNKSGDAQAQWLYRALTTPAPRSMLLTSSLPRDDELDAAMQDACYQLVRRAGIVASNALPEGTRKKQTQYFFSAGSVLASRFTGDVYQVGPRNTHPVYRYAKPIFLGVAL